MAFEDKRGDENLSFRAQKDMNTLVLNDEFTHVENNSKTIIDNDKEETVEANSILTVNKDYTQNIKENQINTVQKEKITTVKEDFEILAKKDLNTIVKRDKKTYVEENVSLSIRNILLKYIEKDVSDKYLENLFIQVANEMGVDIKDSFHLDTTNILYEGVNEITLEATSGISLRCGGNVATVNSSGIFFHTPNYVKNSPDNGVDGTEVNKILIEKAIKKLNIEKIFFSE
ncbi:bacteriophage T4 gp5 trimerization domain-containing protein [Campylobacterota bacterium DY0563]